MVIISPAVADRLAAANAARAPGPAPAANNLDPAAALSSLFDVVHGTTATADVTPWWSSPPPSCFAGSSGVYAGSSSFPPAPPPPVQTHGGSDLACCYAGPVMDTSFPQLPAAPPVYMQPEPSYFYYPQPFPLQVPTTQLASTPPSTSLHYYPQTQATTTTAGRSASAEEASPAIADTQQAQEDDDTRPAAPRRRGRPCKRAAAVSAEPPPAVSKPTKRRIAVGSKSNRAASPSSSHKTNSAATGSATTTMSSSAAGHQVPDMMAGASSSSTGSTADDAAAATAPPPELTTTVTTPGPQYADTLPVGVRFHPTDQELVGYLRMKHARQQMPVNFIKEFDVYQAHPMAIRDACGESRNGCWYAFSRRDRKYRNGRRPARSVFVDGSGGQRQQVGFWKSNSKLGDVLAGGGKKKGAPVVGRMTSLTFQVGRQPRGKQTGWKMKEYTIPENQHLPDGSAMLLNDWVVCKLCYKERPTCTTNSESKTDEKAISVAVGQKRQRRSGKSKKDKNAIRAAVGVEDEPGEEGEEDMQPQMAPAAHQASDYSEQDLCVEDYLVCDVAFGQQNDAANCTI